MTRIVLLCAVLFAGGIIGRAEPAEVKLSVQSGHPWTPPFGLDRVGRPMEAVVTYAGSEKPAGEYLLVGYRDGKEISRQAVSAGQGQRM